MRVCHAAPNLMLSQRGPMRFVRLLALVSIIVGIGGCQKWVTVEDSPVDGSRVTAQEKILVVLTSGDRIQLAEPIRVEGDSLSGRGRYERPSSWPDQVDRVRIALADISEIKVERRDHTATGISFGAGAIAVFIVGGFIGLALVT